ncbi:cyclopropane fatty acyl phospholipid synthase [Echinicola jeungdonensis]
MDAYQKTIQDLLQDLDITINGSQPWDIQVHQKYFFKRVLQSGSVGLGEAYMDGWWDCESLDQFFTKILGAELDKKVKGNWNVMLQGLKARIFNQQNRAHSKKVIAQHYNTGNGLYEKMLDKHMMYSCGYWDGAETLEQAQENKLELICQKLKLEPGMKVLDIGCGWGGFAAYAAKNYQVQVVGITVSEEQEKLAKKRCEGLPIEIRLQDYRDVDEQFDRILSIGMIEHVGYKNYPVYMKVVNRLLKDDGITLIHTIGGNKTGFVTDPWINKYIFANSLIPSAAQLSNAMEPYFILEDWHNFGLHYDYTLMEWLRRFKAAWPELQGKYNERFYRMWEYYLSSCAGSFRSRKNNLWQIVMVKSTYPKEYKSVRFLGKQPAVEVEK